MSLKLGYSTFINCWFQGLILLSLEQENRCLHTRPLTKVAIMLKAQYWFHPLPATHFYYVPGVSTTFPIGLECLDPNRNVEYLKEYALIRRLL
jgi:hypothetical protein